MPTTGRSMPPRMSGVNRFIKGPNSFDSKRLATRGSFRPCRIFASDANCCNARRANERPHPVLSGQDIAPNMGLAANLFKSAEVRLNGHTLERITERLPQIDALKTRMRNTGSWLDQVGKTTNFWEPDFYKRREQVCVDGYLPSLFFRSRCTGHGSHR